MARGSLPFPITAYHLAKYSPNTKGYYFYWNVEDKRIGVMDIDNDVTGRLAILIRDRDLAQKHAKQLQEYGFTVIRVASRGVSFTGSVDQFRDTFKWDIEPSENGVNIIGDPIIPEILEEGGVSVYIPTKPIFFQK